MKLLLVLFALAATCGGRAATAKKVVAVNDNPYVFEAFQPQRQREVQEESCAATCPEIGVEFAGEMKDEIFNQISASEMASIVDYLKAEGVVTLNRDELASADDALNTNHIMGFALDFPVKAEALAYLDEDGPKPDRYGVVTVNRGSMVPRDVMVSFYMGAAEFKSRKSVCSSISRVASSSFYPIGLQGRASCGWSCRPGQRNV
jgi:hypothetical protein